MQLTFLSARASFDNSRLSLDEWGWFWSACIATVLHIFDVTAQTTHKSSHLCDFGGTQS
jgi:hypothetical protein